jgi:hypothetical protein
MLVSFQIVIAEWCLVRRGACMWGVHVHAEVLTAGPNQPYDARADIWSVGVILYVLLFKVGGRPPARLPACLPACGLGRSGSCTCLGTHAPNSAYLWVPILHALLLGWISGEVDD